MHLSMMLLQVLVGLPLFAKAYGGTAADYGYSIAQILSGGYVVAGYTESYGAGGDILVLKLNPDGSIAWAKAFGGSDYECAYSIIQSLEGGYAVTGRTSSFGAGGSDILVLKLNPDGSLAWAKTFGGSSEDAAYAMLQSSDGGYLVVGYTQSFGVEYVDILVLKLNPDGSLAWARTFGGNLGDYAQSVIQTQDGGYAVAGYTASFGAGSSDVLVLKLNSDGSLAWARTFGGTGPDGALSLTQASDGGYILAGYTYSFGAGSWDFLVLKMNPNGSLAWAKTFGGADYEYANFVTQASDGGYILAGYTHSFGAGSSDFLILKLDKDGSIAWAKTFGSGGLEYPYSLIQASDGGFVVAGHTNSFGAGESDLVVLSLDQNGDYPGCVEDCSPAEVNITPATWSPSMGAVCSPQTSSPSIAVIPSGLVLTDVCPSGVEERDAELIPAIDCSPIRGGLLFVSHGDVMIKIYRPDGRLAYSGNLMKGSNRIDLKAGVYLWATQNQAGVVSVR
ncbi:MAG: hypothetical protein ABIM88_03905 [candidate division WOR-3 bacterium]